MHMTPKQARQFGLAQEEPKPDTSTTTVQPQDVAAPRPAKPPATGYAAAGLAGWMFYTGVDYIAAFRCRRDGGVERTARLPPGEPGDDLGSHYRPAVEAIDRGEYVREEEP